MKKLLLTTSLLLSAFFVWAGPRDARQMKISALQAINKVRAEKQLAPISVEPQQLHKTAGITVLGTSADGFAVLSNDDRLPEVLGVSDRPFSGTANPSFAWWLKAISEVCENPQPAGPARVTKPDTDRFPSRVDPLVSALWDQEGPYWNLCPVGSSGRCLTGCVATAIAQVFYTNKYPTTGQGSRTIYYGSIPVSANFGETVYEYDKMIDDYRYGYTQEQADAVALLMKDCGVAVNMSYAPDGSGAYSEDAAEGIRTYFGVQTAHLVERENFSEPQWMEMVYTELASGHPMYYSAVDNSSWFSAGGHAFVCDGYDENGRVHINWGWSGSDNGFYDIALLNPSGYKFSAYQDMILGMYDPDDVHEPLELLTLSVETTAADQLADLIPADDIYRVKDLTISGPLSANDLALIRLLASGEPLEGYEEETKGHLSVVDLTYAELPEASIADNCFQDAKLLRKVTLPVDLERIGSYVFDGCSRLSWIKSRTFNVPAMGTRVFNGVSAAAMTVYVIAGSKDYFTRNAQWKTILSNNNFVEYGTALKAKNATRNEGEANPVFGYTMYGERVVGSPRLWTDANIDSPAGKYTINIEHGSIEPSPDLVLVPGTLTVKENPVTAIDALQTPAPSAPSYTIQGTRTTTPKGLVIKNGKKHIVK